MFLTSLSKATVQRAIKKLSELKLIIIHTRTKARSVNYYSMPDIDTLFKHIRLLNLKYINDTKPNEKTAQIKRFIIEKKKPLKHNRSEIQKKEILKRWRERERKNKALTPFFTVNGSREINIAVLETVNPFPKKEDAKINPIKLEEQNSETRPKDFYHLLHKFRLFDAFKKFQDLAVNIPDEEIITYANIARRKGRSPNAYFKFLLINRSYAPEEGEVDPLTEYRKLNPTLPT